MADLDIGKELLEKIRAEFQNRCRADKRIQSVLRKVDNGTAKLEEISLLSKQLGIYTSQVIGEFIKAEALPEGRMYYNIADTILTGVLKDNYDVINSAAAECQKALDRKAGINIAPQQAAFPVERIQAVASAASAPDIDEDKMIRRMTAPAQNITESFHNDYVKANADFRSNAGLDCFIVRNDHGGCCEWCSKLAGRYRYPEDVPKDVYRRHDNCGCTVTYVNGRKAQNVWDKSKWNISEEELEQMKKAGSRQPERLVDISGKSGIIKESNKKPVTKITDNAINRVENIKIAGYTDEQCEFIQQQHKELLKYSRANNDNKEVAFVFDGELNDRKEFLGEDDRLDFGGELYGKDLFVMHNHPRNSSYSLNDIVEFFSENNVKSLTIVKNNGKVEVLTKVSDYDRMIAMRKLDRMIHKNIKTGSDSEYRVIVNKFLNKYIELGVIEWLK